MNAVVNQDIMNQLIEEMKANTTPCEIPTAHYLTDGMYCRMVLMRKGTLFVGRVHTKPHFFIIAQGILRVAIGEEKVQDFIAPTVLCVEPGTQKAGLVLADMICITVHRTDKIDLEDIEADISKEDPRSVYGVGNTLKTLGYKP